MQRPLSMTIFHEIHNALRNGFMVYPLEQHSQHHQQLYTIWLKDLFPLVTFSKQQSDGGDACPTDLISTYCLRTASMGPFATPHTGNNNNGSRKKLIATSVCTVCVDCSATSYINNSKAPHDWKSCLTVVLCLFVLDTSLISGKTYYSL